MNEEEKNVELKPKIVTYVRLSGLILSDAITVLTLYTTFNPIIATGLTAFVLVITGWAAWKNNSLTTGAIAADAMKDVLTDAANVKTITGTWNDVQAAAGQVYMAIKETKG